MHLASFPVFVTSIQLKLKAMNAKVEKIITEMEPNLSTTERVVSVISGGILLARAIKKKSWLRGAAAGYALFRGTTGFCPLQNVIGKDAAHHLIHS